MSKEETLISMKIPRVINTNNQMTIATFFQRQLGWIPTETPLDVLLDRENKRLIIKKMEKEK